MKNVRLTIAHPLMDLSTAIMPLLPASHFSFRSGSSTPSPLPPAGSHLLVTDTLTASADFVIYHVVLESLRAGRLPSGDEGRVLVVDFSGGRKSAGHWEAIGKKLVSMSFCRFGLFVDILPFQGSPIPLKQSDTFQIINPSSYAFSSHTNANPSLYTDADEPTLQAVYQSISERISNNRTGVVVLDDLSELLLLGFSAQEIARFVRAVLALGRKVRPPRSPHEYHR